MNKAISSFQSFFSFLIAQRYYVPVLLLLLHLASYTFWQGILGAYLSPLIPLVTGGLLLKLLATSADDKVESLPDPIFFRHPKRWLVLIILGIFCVQLVLLYQIIDKFPIDGFKSDVIPTIEIAVRRFLNHEVVYQPITDFGRVQPVTYLPLTWLPFVPAHLLQLDYRLWSFLLLSLIIALIQYRLISSSTHRLTQLLVAVLPGLVVLIWMQEQDQDFGYTCETLIAAYYMLLTYSILYDKKGWLLSISILFCLLSRYSVVLFLPPLFVYCYRQYGRQRTIICSVLIAIGVLLIYIIPFWLKDPAIFMQGYAYYTQSALGEWVTQSWQNPGDRPFHLYRGTGMAAYFHSLDFLDLAERLQALKHTHLVVSLVVSVISCWVLLKCKDSRVQLNLVLGLYGYFLLFYTLIQSPYSYLYLVLILMELMLVYWLVIERNASIAPKSVNQIR